MVEMTLTGLALDAATKTPIVLLRDPSGRRQIPIWIDHYQAHNIMAGLKESPNQRPLTHDLMVSLLKAGEIYLERVIIHSIEENSFKAVLKLRKQKEGSKTKVVMKENKTFLELEASASDAIALAIRTKCSIWMIERVLAEASIPVSSEEDIKDQENFRRFVADISPASLIQHLNEKKDTNKSDTD